MSYPYKVDYNDHFETPMVAYEDILPILDALCPLSRRGVGGESEDNKYREKARSKQVLYDPYYCDGKAASFLAQLGFENVRHEKRDFYKDIKNNEIPLHHTLITNPPYSGDHKERCVRFAVDNLRNNSESPIPFLILMPNYIACRNHFRSAILSEANSTKDPLDIFYVVPSNPYEYEHPDGTGKEIPPFASIWFCGIPLSKLEAVKHAFRRKHGNCSVGLQGGKNSRSQSPRLLCSLQDLKAIGAVPTQKRKNVKQRRREKRKRERESQLAVSMNSQVPSEIKVTSAIPAERLNNAKRRRREKRAADSQIPAKKIQEKNQDGSNKVKIKQISHIQVRNAKQRRREKRKRDKGESSITSSEAPQQAPQQKQKQSHESTNNLKESSGDAVTQKSKKFEHSTTSIIHMDKLKNAKQRRRDKRKRHTAKSLIAPETGGRLQKPKPENTIKKPA